MKKTALIFCSYDGIVSQYCWIWTISKNFLSCAAIVNSELKNKMDIHIISPFLNDTCLWYDSDLFEENKKIAENNWGELHFVMNGSDGFEQYWSMQHRKCLSIWTANKILEISKKYEKIICVYTDTPFLQTPYYINIQKNDVVKNIKHFLYIHSDTFVHSSSRPDIERLSRETWAISYSKFVDNVYIINTNDFFMKNLHKNYNFSKDKIVTLKNWINLQDDKYSDVPEKTIITYFKKYWIPADKKIIFSFWRAVPYKWFEILLHAYKKLSRSDCHLVFIAAPYIPHWWNVPILKKIIADNNIKKCTAIYDVDFFLPSILCQRKNTKAVIQLSLAEPFWLIPEEVRVRSRKNWPISICSNLDGYIEQITDNEDWFLVDPLNIWEIIQKINKVLNMNDKDFLLIKKKGFDRLIKEFNYLDNLKCFFKEIWIC